MKTLGPIPASACLPEARCERVTERWPACPHHRCVAVCVDGAVLATRGVIGGGWGEGRHRLVRERAASRHCAEQDKPASVAASPVRFLLSWSFSTAWEGGSVNGNNTAGPAVVWHGTPPPTRTHKNPCVPLLVLCRISSVKRGLPLLVGNTPRRDDKTHQWLFKLVEFCWSRCSAFVSLPADGCKSFWHRSSVIRGCPKRCWRMTSGMVWPP